MIKLIYKLKTIYHHNIRVLFGSYGYRKDGIKIYNPKDIAQINVGQTIAWVNRADCTFGFDNE